MLINETALSHWIKHFYGYGSWQARFWFIALEDGGGDLPNEVAEKLNYFRDSYPAAEQPTLCNIRDLYKHSSMRPDGPKAELFRNHYDYCFGSQAVQSNVWKNLIAFEFGYRGDGIPDLLKYQKNSFADPSNQQEALIKLYPLPSPNNHAWYYSWLDLPQLEFLKSRAHYEEYVYPTRISNILMKINQHKPELVLMYGMQNINVLKKSIQDIFPEAKFKIVKAVKQQIPQYHQADIQGTTLLITTQIPALRHNRIETGFDWEKFGQKVRSGS